MSEVIAGDGFTVKTNNFEFFFGRVTSNPKNEGRSLDNLDGLRQLGIEEEADGREPPIKIFRSGLKGPQVGIKGDRWRSGKGVHSNLK